MKHLYTHHIDETDFVVLDVETTGLSVENSDRVCEIGAVKIRGGAVVDTFGSLINPQRPISSGAYAVNQISPKMLQSAPIFPNIIQRLTTMMKDAVLVAYNAPFDLSFINNEFRLSGYPVPPNPVVDALVIARQLLPGIGRYNQENVASVLNLSFPVKHRAQEDAMMTAKIFTVLTSILKAYDLTTIGDLTRRDLSSILQTKRSVIIQQTMDGRKNLWIKYLSPKSAEITDRVITPKTFSTEYSSPPNQNYLLAFCHLVKDERTFRIDRILDIRTVEPL
jgi:DNA polymerase III epsilon subunit family exonuclease